MSTQETKYLKPWSQEPVNFQQADAELRKLRAEQEENRRRVASEYKECSFYASVKQFRAMGKSEQFRVLDMLKKQK